MKLLTLIFILSFLSGCNIFRKSVNQQRQDINKSLQTFVDSIGQHVVDSTVTNLSTGWVTSSVDSAYEKVIEEYINEVADSNVIHTETKRIIKERGKKTVEQASTVIKYDSAGEKTNNQTHLSHLQREDSSATVIAIQKNVSRTSFLPWWIWLIAAALIALGWWQRNPIIEFLKSKI